MALSRCGEMLVTESTKSFNSALCSERNSFIGDIQGSLMPKVVMFASPWRDLAMRVRVRWARTPGWSRKVSRSPRVVRGVASEIRGCRAGIGGWTYL